MACQNSKFSSESPFVGFGAEVVPLTGRPPPCVGRCSLSRPRSDWGSSCFSLCDICNHLAFGFAVEANETSIEHLELLSIVERLTQ